MHGGVAPELRGQHVTRKRDIKQVPSGLQEAGLTIEERYKASEALHAEKESAGGQEDMGYPALLAWLDNGRHRGGGSSA